MQVKGMPASLSKRAAPVTDLPKILAVDDRRENLAVIKAMLGRVEAEVVLVDSGRAALAALEDEEYAVMLLDVSMPEMDGYEVASRMQETGMLAQVPVIFVTAIDRDERSLMEGYKASVVEFIFKPMNPAILRSKVHVFLNLYNARKAQELVNGQLLSLQQDLIVKRGEAEAAAREIGLAKLELEFQNEELLRRNRELDSFAHVLSHDLRQPLQSILDYLELIGAESGASLPPDATRWFASCARLGRGMSGLITDVLEYATLGSQQITKESTDCNAALAGALERLTAAIKESDACIVHDELPRLPGSEELLTRVFQDLIANAIKYRIEATPRIEVRCQWDPSRHNWLFRVIDNGRGGDPKDFGRVFEMFARGRMVSTLPGTGIGLAVCKRIVEAHAGRMWVTSKENEGSEFCFVLPGGAIV